MLKSPAPDNGVNPRRAKMLEVVDHGNDRTETAADASVQSATAMSLGSVLPPRIATPSDRG